MGEPFDWQNRKLFNEASNEVQGAAERLSNMQKRLQYARTKSARNDAMETIRNFQRENRDLLALNEQRKNAFAQVKDLDTRKEQIRKSGYSQARKDELLNQLDDRQYKIMKQFNSRFLDTVR
jgi:predicted RNase H-like nuclease (RuvC/YqgF family)